MRARHDAQQPLAGPEAVARCGAAVGVARGGVAGPPGRTAEEAVVVVQVPARVRTRGLPHERLRAIRVGRAAGDVVLLWAKGADWAADVVGRDGDAAVLLPRRAGPVLAQGEAVGHGRGEGQSETRARGCGEARSELKGGVALGFGQS